MCKVQASRPPESNRDSVQSPNFHSSRFPASRVQTPTLPESKRSESKRPSFHACRVHACRVQAPMLGESKRPESKRPGVQSLRVQNMRPEFSFSGMPFENNFKTVTEMNCKIFVEAAIIEPIITLMFIKYESFFEHLFLLFWKTPAAMNFKFFVEATIYEPIIMMTALKHFNNPFCLSKSHRSKWKSLNKIRHNTKQTFTNQTEALWRHNQIP